MCDRLNQKLRGWKEYFRLGNPWKAYRVLDEHVEDRVRHFLRRRHKVPSQGASQFSRKTIFGKLRVFRLQAGQVTPVRESAKKSFGKPDALAPQARVCAGGDR
jgi:group II intron maturase